MKSLRPYQTTAIEKINEALRRGVNKQILSLATGLGKTFTAVQAVKEYKRVLWLTHTEELIDQSAAAFVKENFDESLSKHIEEKGIIEYVRDGGLFAGGGFKMGVIKADVFQPYGNVVMASAATLHRRLDRIDPYMFDSVVVDECHLAAAKSWVMSLNHVQPQLLLGLSATPRREDNLQLGDVFDEIVYEYGIKDGVDNGYLCELDAIRVQTTISLDNVRTTAGELNQKDLSNEINTPQRNQLVVSSYLKYANGRQGIFFCVDIDHAIKLAAIFNEMGVSCRAVSGDEELTPDRSGSIKAFKEGKIQILTNCQVLTAGFDHADTGVIGHASPTKSLTKYLQCTGRGTRLKSTEYVSRFGQNCIILDFIDNTSRHNLVNAWELDKQKDPEDRTFITKEKRDLLIEERRKRKAKVEVERKEDERFKLLAIPQIKLSNSIRMQEAATDAQLKWIESLGYDIVNQSYTKEMCSRIIMDLPATEKQVKYIHHLGYDTSSYAVITRGMVEAAMRDREKRQAAAEREKKNQNIQKNLPFKF